MSNILSGKVVFDDALLGTFLSMAAQEGLLLDEPTKSDGFLNRYQQTQPDPHLKRLVLEQIVLTPTLVMPKWMPLQFLSGPLIDRGVFEVREDATEAPLQVDSLSIDILSAMLKARGHTFPESEYFTRMNAAKAALDEEDDYRKATGKEPPGFGAWFAKRVKPPL